MNSSSSSRILPKPLLWLYTLLVIAMVPLVIVIPILTARQTGPGEFVMDFPVLFAIPPVLILEFILRRRYRKAFTQLPLRYWIITGATSLTLTILPLLMVLPGLPLHNEDLSDSLHATGSVLIFALFGILLQTTKTMTEIFDRRRMPGLYKKDVLFK